MYLGVSRKLITQQQAWVGDVEDRIRKWYNFSLVRLGGKWVGLGRVGLCQVRKRETIGYRYGYRNGRT